MPVLAIFTGNGINRESYESLRKEVSWESQPPPGLVFHAASFDEGGHVRVADVWESAESMDAFFKARLFPAMQKLGVPAPSAAVYPTHNINAFGAVEQFRVR